MSTQQQGLQLCTFRVGDETLGVEASSVLEGLRRCCVRPVPLAPGFVAGVLPYRGDLLMAISLRTLLGLDAAPGAVSALVLRDKTAGEPFALLVDALADVQHVDIADWEPNPTTLDEQRRAIFCGAYKRDFAPLARLETARLQPSWLMRNDGDKN